MKIRKPETIKKECMATEALKNMPKKEKASFFAMFFYSIGKLSEE